MTRGRWIAIVVLLLSAGLAAAAPMWIRRELEGRLAVRTGCAITLGAIWPRVDGVVIDGVAAECPFGTASVAHLEADVDWRALRPQRIRVREGVASLRERPAFAAPATAVGARDTSLASAERPSVSIEQLRFELVSSDGVIVAGELAADLQGDLLRISLRDTQTSPAYHPTVHVDEAQVSLDLRERLVEALDVRGLDLAARDGEQLENVLRRWAQPQPPSTDHAPADSPRMGPWEHLRSGATLRVSDATVRDGEGDALTGLDAELTRIEGSRLRTRGQGQPRGTGRLSWDLRVDAAREEIDGPITVERVPLSVLLPFLPTLPLHQPQDALVSAELTVRTEEAAVVFDGSVGVVGLALESARLASEPVVGIAATFQGAGRWDRHAHLLELERGTLQLGDARAFLAGRLMMEGDRYAIDVRAELPSTPCDAAIHAIPRGMLQELSQMHLEGRLAASIVLRVDSERLDETLLRFAIEDRCRFTTVPALADVTRFQVPFRHEVLEPDGSVFTMDTGPGTVAWTPMAEISPFLVHAVLAHEDASFFSHRGFAPWAIRDALVRNLRERRYVLGASTITMQLVKNVFLRREKTLARKVQEVLLTWWLESSLTKPQILELYLNVIEYGPSVYGIRAAASHYFGRTPAELSVAEAAYLAMILPNPPRFHELYDAGALTPSFRRRTEGFVGVMARRGRIDAAAEAQGRDELGAFVFSRAGERVGPDVLAGGTAQLPIEGFSGTPFGAWRDEESDPESGTEEEDEPESAEGWGEVWQ